MVTQLYDFFFSYSVFLNIYSFFVRTIVSIRALQFANKPLGELRSVLPIKELASLLPKPKKVGAKGWLDNEACPETSD